MESEGLRRRSSSLRFPLYLALRYARSTRGDALITTLSATTGLGIAVGVTALILALAVLSGFQRRLLDDVLAHSAEVQVLMEPAQVEQVRARVEETPGVDSVQRIVVGTGWLVDRGDYRPVEIVGVERSLPRWFPAEAGIEDGEPVTGLVLSETRRLSWGLIPGDRVRLVTPRPMLTPLGRPMPSRREATVVGSFDAGRAESETERVVLPFDFARTLVGRGDLRLDLELSQDADPVSVARALRASLPEGTLVETWQDRHRALLFVLALEKSLIFVAVFLIVLVASLALVAAMALLLSSKLSDVGALSAMGARIGVLQRAFLLLGLMLGGVGATVGAVTGIGIAWLLDRFELLRLPEGVYIVDHVPFLVRPVDVAAVVGASVLLALLASSWAARRVGAFEPVEALQS